jgi:MarR family transcriptional regulator, negative regulator of the multidrug operon emrRAB
MAKKLRTANLLGALACEIAARLDERLKKHPNESDSAAAALNVIGFYEGCSNNALSRALKLSHTTTVRLIDKLAAYGLVERRQAADRRAVSLFLTKRGRERAQAVVQDRCVALGEIVDALGERQRAQFDRLAETLLRSLTTSADEADHICRLCDDSACPPENCPVHKEALSLNSSAGA